MRWREAAIVAVVAGVLGRASGQTLDLSGAPAPVVDASTASSELASFLYAQAAEIRGRASTDPALACAAALRTLAGALLDSAQELGEPASVRVVSARKIVRVLPALDTALTGGAVPAPMARMASDDLTALAANLPRRQEQLDRALRDALAPLTNALAGPVEGGPPESLAAMVPEGRGIDRTAFERVDAMLEGAWKFTSHAPSARRTHAAAARAMGVLTVPGWMPAAARESLVRSLTEATGELLDASTADRGLTQLDRLGRFAAIVASVDGMRDEAVRRVAIERLATLAIELETSPNQAARAERAMSIVLREAEGANLEEVEAWLPGPLRIAWRARQEELSAARERLVASMFELLDRSDPMIEPALLSALRAYRAARANVAAMGPMAALLTGEAPIAGTSPRGRPRMLKAYGRLSSRLLEAGHDLSEPGKAEEAGAMFATLSGLARALEPEAGEAALGAGVDADGQSWWARATGGRAGAIVDRLEAVRATMREQVADVEQWAAAMEAATEVQKIKSLVALLSALQVLEAEGRARFNADACCELSEPAWEGVTADLAERLSAATQRVLDGGDVDVDEFAVARLIALVVGGWPQAAEGGAGGVLVQIGTGAPGDDGALELDRVGLAVICRNLEELASARLRGEAERAARLEEETGSRALRVLETAERR